MEKIIRFVAINDRGYRIGKWHQNATLSDETVDLIRELREECGKTYGEIAKMTGVNRSTVVSICKYKRRAQTIDGWRKVLVTP